MDVREKLVELIKRFCNGLPVNDIEPPYGYENLADYLISNGVTVQDGKPLEAFLHPVDAYEGLKAKYLVFKADTGEKVDNCFILRPDKEPVAVEALRAYANATGNKTLAEDIYSWVGKGEPMQEWISVKDRLPQDSANVLVCHKNGLVTTNAWLDNHWWFKNERNPITHWMPLPQPPKGE